MLRDARRKLYRILAEDAPETDSAAGERRDRLGDAREAAGLASCGRPSGTHGVCHLAAARRMRPRLARYAHTRQVARAACATWPAQPPPPRTQALAARRRYRPRMHDALSTARLLAVARGEEAPDTVIEGAQVFCAFTREWLEGDVAIADGRFAGVGRL